MVGLRQRFALTRRYGQLWQFWFVNKRIEMCDDMRCTTPYEITPLEPHLPILFTNLTMITITCCPFKEFYIAFAILKTNKHVTGRQKGCFSKVEFPRKQQRQTRYSKKRCRQFIQVIWYNAPTFVRKTLPTAFDPKAKFFYPKAKKKKTLKSVNKVIHRICILCSDWAGP